MFFFPMPEQTSFALEQFPAVDAGLKMQFKNGKILLFTSQTLVKLKTTQLGFFLQGSRNVRKRHFN